MKWWNNDGMIKDFNVLCIRICISPSKLAVCRGSTSYRRSSVPSWGLQQRPRRLGGSALYSSLLTDGKIWYDYTLYEGISKKDEMVDRPPTHKEFWAWYRSILLYYIICVVQFILICRIKDHTISEEFVVLLCLARGISGRWLSIMSAVDPSWRAKQRKIKRKRQPLNVFFFWGLFRFFNVFQTISWSPVPFFHILLAGCVWRLLETWMSRLEAGLFRRIHESCNVWSQSSLVKCFERACWYRIHVCFLSFYFSICKVYVIWREYVHSF